MRPHHLSLLGLLAGVAPLAAQVRPGIEVLLADSIHLVAGKRVALLTNQTGVDRQGRRDVDLLRSDRKSTRLNSSHLVISYAVFCLKKKIKRIPTNDVDGI